MGERPLLGKPIAEAMPELTGQPIFGLLDEVYRTGESFHAHEMLVQLDHDNAGGDLGQNYYNFIYQATRNLAGDIDGILVFAYEVTAQVRARQQVEYSRQQVQDLNEELETRVAERTQDARAARAEAERQRARLERFFMQAPAAICILDGSDLVYELVNPAYQQLFPGRQLLGKSILEALPEIADNAVYRTFREVYETGITHEEQGLLIPIARPEDGVLEDRYFNYIQQARYDEQGRNDGVLVFAFEVTAQVQAQQQSEALQAEVLVAAQRQAQEREAFYQVFEQTPASIAILRGPEHRFEYLNLGYQQLFAGRNLLGYPIAEALPETVAFGFVALLNQVYQTGEPYFGTELPLQMEAPDGSLLPEAYFTFTYQAYHENGTIVGVSIFAFEVTEQVLARRQRTTQQQQLRELFEQAPVAIAVFQGPEYVIEVANPRVAALWGRTPAQVLGKTLLDALPEVRDQGFRELLDEVVRTSIPFVAREVAALLQRNGQLETVYLDFVYQPLRDEQGRITSVAAVATDVSEQVAARQQLAQANQELTASNRELDITNQQLTRTNVDLDNFIYTASHDLKAPILNIEGLMEALLDQLPPASLQLAPVQRTMDLILGSVQRFKRTIDHLTEITKLQKKNSSETSLVNLAVVIADVQLDLAPAIQAAQAQLDVDVTTCPTIRFSEKNLRSIIYNLLSNAIKYRSPERAPLVRVHCHETAAYQVLSVQDNGLGMDLSREHKLFAMFKRLHDHVEGSGIGLYMVKRIIENAGGKIEVQSKVGEGSVFHIHFRRNP